MNELDITYQIRGAIYDVYKNLGPGLLESVYEEALAYEITKRGLNVKRQVQVPINYDGHQLATPLRIDLLVEDQVVVEIKAVEKMKELFHLQTLTYLRLAHLHRGILVNFNCEDILDSIWPKVNGYQVNQK